MGADLNVPAAPAVAGADHVHSGKVRDLYRLADGTLLMVASDRISAYDFVLAWSHAVEIHCPDSASMSTTSVSHTHLSSVITSTLPDTNFREREFAQRFSLVQVCIDGTAQPSQ